MYIKKLIVFTLLLATSGCSSFIANQITSFEPKPVNFQGDAPDILSIETWCDTEQRCISAQLTNQYFNNIKTLSFSFDLNGNKKLWSYKVQEGADSNKPLQGELILIFPGYGQPPALLAIHQKWLEHISGADVVVVTKTTDSATFNFGLEFTSPIVREIKSRNPKRVHLIGFSMGAVAAQSIAEKVDNAHLHLIAPMTDFSSSSKAVWNMQYQQKFYSLLFSETNVNDAIEKVIRNSGVDKKELDLLKKSEGSSFPIHVYGSLGDRVTPVAAWETSNNRYIEVHRYQSLNHYEMIALADKELLATFTSNLLAQAISESNTEILGTLCEAKKSSCGESNTDRQAGE